MMELTASERRDFFDQGFFIRKNLFAPDEVARISAALDEIYVMSRGIQATSEFQGTQFVMERGVLSRAVWCGAAKPELLKFGEDRRITKPVAALLEIGEADQIICQAHYKMPGDGVEYRWHQDSENRGYGTPDWNDLNGKGSYVQTVMAVDPMTEENGPIFFVPGSCKRGHLALDQMDDPSKAFDVGTLVPVIMSPGSVAFFGPYAIHGSLPNSSPNPRRIFINGFAYPGANARKYPGKGSCRRVQLI